MSSTAQPVRKRRSWPRFTLRVLLAAITLLCIGLGIWTHRAREQGRIVEMIRASHGSATHYHHRLLPRGIDWYLGEDFCYSVISVSTRDRAVIRELPNLPGLEIVEIDHELLTDADIEPLRQLAGLRMIFIGSARGKHGASRIGDASLEWIAKMEHIGAIRLDTERITSKGVNALAQSPTLQIIELYCADASIDADALAAIRRAKGLSALRIWRSTPTGWEKLAEWDPKRVL